MLFTVSTTKLTQWSLPMKRLNPSSSGILKETNSGPFEEDQPASVWTRSHIHFNIVKLVPEKKFFKENNISLVNKSETLCLK